MQISLSYNSKFCRFILIYFNDYHKNDYLEIVLRKDDSPKFKVIPKRWIVERTFACFESYRRLSKDFEYHTDTNQAMIQLAMVKLMLNRINI